MIRAVPRRRSSARNSSRSTQICAPPKMLSSTHCPTGSQQMAARPDVDALKAAAVARESQSPTGLPGGIAIPHCRDASIATASLGFAGLSPKVNSGGSDGPADLVFLIAAPAGAGPNTWSCCSGLARIDQAGIRAIAAGRGGPGTISRTTALSFGTIFTPPQ